MQALRKWAHLGAAVICLGFGPWAVAQPSPDAQHGRQPVAFEPLNAPGLSIEAHWYGVTHMKLRSAATGADPDAGAMAVHVKALEDAAGTDRIWALLDPEIATRDEFRLPDWIDALPLDRVVSADRVEQTRAAIDKYFTFPLVSVTTSTYDTWETAVLPELSGRAGPLLESLAGESDLLGRTLAALGLERGDTAARVVLVPLAPPPGARTYRTRKDPVSIVAVSGLDDETLLEVTLHEIIHAFDAAATGDRADVLALLRAALRDAGLDERDPRFRAAWHAIFFVHAAEMVRRDGRPEYADYGERFGVYEKSGDVAGVVRERWPRVLEGELDVESFVRDVASAAVAG